VHAGYYWNILVCDHPFEEYIFIYIYRSVPHIHPPFATLVLVKNVGGAYMPDLTFYLASTPPLLVPRLDVHVLQTDTEAGSTHSYTGLSRV